MNNSYFLTIAGGLLIAILLFAIRSYRREGEIILPPQSESLYPINPKNNNTCGISSLISPFIIGGQNSVAGKYPFMVFGNGCSGCLIKPDTILTTAHCKYRVGGVVGMGFFNLLDPNEKQRQQRTIREIRIHPQYDSKYLNNDIAILKLDSPFTLNNFVNIICLPDANWDLQNTQMTVIGWGSVDGGNTPRSSSPILKEANVSQYNSADQIFGAGTPNAVSCFGDSGGPIVINVENKFYVVGLTSFGSEVCKSPAYYTRVGYYLSWINEN